MAAEAMAFLAFIAIVACWGGCMAIGNEKGRIEAGFALGFLGPMGLLIVIGLQPTAEAEARREHEVELARWRLYGEPERTRREGAELAAQQAEFERWREQEMRAGREEAARRAGVALRTREAAAPPTSKS